MNKKFGYRATWEPSRPMIVGRYGKIRRGVFDVHGSLEDFDIRLEISEKRTSNDLEYVSEGSTQISTKLGGSAGEAFDALTDAEAGIAVDFSGENAIVFKANGITHHIVTNKGEIERRVMELFQQGRWQKDYVIVSEVLAADAATILITNSKDAKIELKAKSDVKAGELDIANAGLNLEVVRNRGVGMKLIAQSGITPLYKLVKLKSKLFGGMGLDTKTIDLGNGNGNSIEWAEVPYEEEELVTD
ncbi:hypothetical protein CRP01_34445 [Flavilitoribacter nigricans DSM 23189 = NBRC 102662]|uniref:Uncharacterized protein n=2 Tax=Flavilitoribacter TaxID=2762562 RepID=A0A2D0N0V5_FLAN2|nr:hypothetical protein CRP01_34445 [Flavilitoribacter nigricans DSM 23189 = NBRC 102662]